MRQTDHDKILEGIRYAEREKLIAEYMQRAIDASKQDYGFLNVRGHEVPDPTVIEPPLGYVQSPDLMEQMRQMVRNEMSRIAEANEFETFEEADDFDIDDDPVDYTSPFELYFDPAEYDDQGPPEAAPAAAPAPLNGEVLPPESPPAPAPGGDAKGAKTP